MKRGNTPARGKQQPNRSPAKPTGVVELTERDLEQVQGGIQDAMKIPGGEGIGKK
ncbi:MAG TPA: hypothetical protein VKT82_06300 [Ktedonobacterales bacterium]|nr:hypothetical protein [Ktedonobacterales bacterium]